MFSIKSILSIIFIIKLLIFTTFALPPSTLYAITSNENLQHSIMALNPDSSPNLVYNSTMNLPSGLTILGVAYIDAENIGLYCIDAFQTSHLINYNVKENKYEIQNSILNQLNYNNGQGTFASAIKQHYIYPQSIQYNSKIYLPAVIEGYNELALLEFWFSNEGGSGGLLQISTVNGTSDIDFTSTPIGGVDNNGGIIVAYNSISDNSTTFTFVNTTSNLKHQINGLNSNQIQLIYSDPNTGFIFVIYTSEYDGQSGFEVCEINFYSLECNTAYGTVPLNPNNYNYNPVFLTSDYQDIITLSQSSSSNSLTFTNWGATFGWSDTTPITNYWSSKNTNTIFAL